MTTRSQGIVVAGMHRSGTSALSGALSRLGIALGDSLVPAAGDNPKGYFEHAGVVAVHEQLFRELGRWWYDPRELPAGWLEAPAARRAEEALVSLLRADFSGAALWAVKDPRTCRFLPLWRRVLARLALPVSVLVVMRPPGEVAASLAARNGFGPELGELLWLRHVLDAVRGSAGMPRTVIVYEDIVREPVAAIDAALQRVGLQAPVPAAERATALAGFVEASYQHHASAAPAAATPVAALAQRVYEAGRALARGQGRWEDFDALDAEFQSQWSAVGPFVQAMGDAVFPDLEARARLAEDIHAARSELAAQVRWGKEMLAQRDAMREQHESLRAELVHQRDQLEVALANARSDLNAQVRWAEDTLAQRDAMREQHESLRAELVHQRDQLEVALANARSDLNAQIGWADQFLQQHRDAVAEAKRQAEADRQCIDELRARLDESSRSMTLIQNSTSWRVTAPLRAVARALGRGRARKPMDTIEKAP